MRIFLFLSILSFQNLNAQQFFDQGNAVQVSANGNILPMAWAGGLNSPQFSEVDINLDGFTDIVAYDRDAYLYIPLIFDGEGVSNEHAYDYIPRYNNVFPETQHWALFRDLNQDGKSDLLTSSIGSVHYYKNTSTPYNTSFEFVETLESKRGGDYTKIFINSADLPLIADLDFDGDLDIATFGVTGTYVDFNENISTTPGEYDFKVTDKCWGDFSESFSTNDVLLNDPYCISQGANQKLMSPQHTGSTLSAFDLDNDNDLEVFIGDVSFNNVVQLTNTPVDGEDRMTSKNMNYPTAFPVDLPVFPAVYFIDVNYDGATDMVVSPNMGNGSDPKNSAWYYKNLGSNENPNFVFNKKNVFQDQMIDLGRYSKVRLFDYNQDNLMDIVVSGGQSLDENGLLISTISLYKNTGTQITPKFDLITENFANINELNLGVHLCPSFADLDNDGKEDMIIGKNDGTLLYFKNNSNAGNPINFTVNSSIASGIDVGYNATPKLYDINSDGKIDLLVGNRAGKISYYENTGTPNSPSFTLVTNTFGNIEIFSPTAQGFLDFDIITEDGNLVIYAGSSRSGINRIENISDNLSGTFTISDSNVHQLEFIRHSSVAFHDFNNDGYLDMLVGSIRGGVEYFNGIDEMAVSTPEYSHGETLLFPNPANNILNIESTVNWDNLEIYSNLGRLIHKDKMTSSIDISALENGLYYIRLSNKVNQNTLTFIKQ